MPDPIVVLTFAKGDRVATVTRRLIPDVGDDLMCQVNGEFIWTQLCRTPEDRTAKILRVRDEFLAKGWTEVPAGS